MDRRRLLALAGALGLGALLPGCSPGPAPTPGPLGPTGSAGPTASEADPLVAPPAGGSTPLASPLDGFADALTPLLAPRPANLVWSPWSVAMVLAMIRAGAAGTTRAELDAVLRAGGDFDSRLVDGWRRMANAEGTPLRAANAVWAQRGETWKAPFLGKLAALLASLKSWDFRADAAGAVPVVNGWVSDRTAGTIPNLLDAGALTPDTRLVLVNAVHVAAAWAHPLVEEGDAPFRAPGAQVSAPFLSTGDRRLAGAKGDGWTRAVLPCERDFALVVVVPDDPAANPAVLGMDAFTGAASSERARAVRLVLPRFATRTRAVLNRPLAAAGMPLAFSAAADFSAMTDDERLSVSLVVHEAVITVDAKGVEAAAATAGVMEAVSGLAGEPIDLVCDRPVAYALVHAHSGTPVFRGQLADPGAGAGG